MEKIEPDNLNSQGKLYSRLLKQEEKTKLKKNCCKITDKTRWEPKLLSCQCYIKLFNIIILGHLNIFIIAFNYNYM